MKRDELFERLEPPPGGLAALHARMDARPRRALRFALPAFAVALVGIVLFVMSRERSPDLLAAARQRGDTPDVALGLAPLPRSTVVIDPEARATTALVEVQTTNPKVAFYWVSSTSWRE